MSLKPINKKFIEELNLAPDITGENLIGSTSKILKLKGHSTTLREAITLLSTTTFRENFLKSGRTFVICVQCRGSLLPLDTQQLAVLQAYKDRPMIFSFESVETGEHLIYYKDFNSQDIKDASNVKNISEIELREEKFTFELLLRALKSKLYGKFNGHLLATEINVISFIEELQLMDLAVMANSVLCIRFLQLFSTHVGFKDFFSSRRLQLAAEICDKDSFLAIFDLNFNHQDFKRDGVRDVVEVKCENDHNLLMIAVEKENVSGAMFLLNLNAFDVNYRAGGSIAADLTTNPRILLMLLQNNSKYPKHFAQIQKSQELSMFCSKVSEIHEAIQAGDDRKAKKVLCNIRLRYFFNTDNKSAAYVALEKRQFKIYEYLLMNKAAIYGDENLEDLNLDHSSKELQKILYERYKSPLYEKCVLDLVNKVKSLNINENLRQVYRFELLAAVNVLFEFEIFRPILQIAAASDIEITIDFDRNSVNFIDPCEKSSIRGYFANNGIFIGGKDLIDESHRHLFLATFIHELTHFVMNFMYENNCRPYRWFDLKRRAEFEEICEICKHRSEKLNLMAAAFTYHPDMQHSELIVRPNHMLAHYYDKPEMIKAIEAKFPEIFKFYRERVYPDKLQTLMWYPEKQAKKRKTDVMRDACEVESLIPRKCEYKKRKSKFKFLLTVIILIFSLSAILGWIFIDFETNSPSAMKVISSSCFNITNALKDLIDAKNVTEIENLSENLNYNLTYLWNLNSSCNSLIYAIEQHGNDVDFIEDLLSIAEEIFTNCAGNLKKLLVASGNILEIAESFGSDRLKKILSKKLNEILSANELKMFLSGKYGEIGGKC